MHAVCDQWLCLLIGQQLVTLMHYALHFPPPKSVAKSEEKLKAPKQIAKGTSRLRRTHWSFFVRDIQGPA